MGNCQQLEKLKFSKSKYSRDDTGTPKFEVDINRGEEIHVL